MILRRATWAVGSVSLALLAAGCAHRITGAVLVDAGAASQAAADRWLALHPQYRLATDADCRCAEELASIRSPAAGSSSAPNYHPYLARGDFNRDGLADAAYGVVKRDAPADFSILVIDGASAAKGRRADSLLSATFKLGAEALFFGPPANPEGGLMVGPFESEACEIVPRRLGGYRLDCSEY